MKKKQTSQIATAVESLIAALESGVVASDKLLDLLHRLSNVVGSFQSLTITLRTGAPTGDELDALDHALDIVRQQHQTLVDGQVQTRARLIAALTSVVAHRRSPHARTH